MIPVLVTIPDWIPLIGGQPITSFGVLLLAAFLVAGALFVRGLRARAPNIRGWDLVVTGAVVSLVGAKVLHLAVNGMLGLPMGLGRGGLHWFGGLAAGAGAVLWQARRRGLSAAVVADAAAAPLALGYALGRIGSFLVGSEYGTPTALPWGMTFPAGSPPTTPTNLQAFFEIRPTAGTMRGDYVSVHPTQLYEAAASLAIFGLLRARPLLRNDSRIGDGWYFGLFLALHGASRTLVELIRAKSDRLVGAVTVDMILAVAAMAVGAWILVRRGRSSSGDGVV